MTAWLRRHRGVRAATLAACLIAAAGTSAWRWFGPDNAHRTLDRRSFRVKQVLAGPSVKVEGRGEWIGLLGAAGDGRQDESARRLVAELCLGQPVTLVLESRRVRDERGRVLAYVYTADGRLLNEMLIEQGLTRADRTKAHRLYDWFSRLEHRARDDRLGVWGETTTAAVHGQRGGSSGGLGGRADQ